MSKKVTNRIREHVIMAAVLSLLLLPGLPIAAQEKTISLNEDSVSLVELFSRIEKKTSYVFFYNDDLIDKDFKVQARFRNKTVPQILDSVFSDTQLTYSINRNQVTIKKKGGAATPKPSTQKPGRTVTGNVYDQNHEPLPGVGILVKGTNIGTITDINGGYTINVPSEDAILVYSYVGFASVQVPASTAESSRQIIMNEDALALDNVVVIGYSTRTREKLISSVSTIGTADLVKSKVPNLSNALSGRVSGVFTRQTSSEPGQDGGNLQIRGLGSALVVVDGVPGRDYTGIDPSEIESISVLKDASATSVYGMQGANGVILVTTKRGEKNRPASLEVSSTYGWQIPYDYPKPATTALWSELVNEYTANIALINNRNAAFSEADMAMRSYAINTDWYKEMMHNAPISQTNINVSGGTEKVNYFVSAGYLNQDGIWITDATSKDRFNFRSNLDVDIIDNLKMSIGVGAIFTDNKYPGYGSGTIARVMKKAAPNIPVRWPGHEDYYAYAREGTDNPMAMADSDASGYSKQNARNLDADMSLEYKVPFIEGLSLKAAMGYTQIDRYNKGWSTDIVYLGYREDSDEYYESIASTYTDKADLTMSTSFHYTITGQGFINYLRSFGMHNINSGLVFEASHSKNHYFQTSRGLYPTTVIDMLSGGLADDQVKNSETERLWRTASMIGRFSYDYASRYFFDFSFRYDGAQYFAQKWGFFPSFSVGWMISNEKFMSGIHDTVNELKLRASWGQMGDLSAARAYYDNNEQYYHQAGWRYPGALLNFGERTIYGLTQTVNANPDFTWSKSTMANAGVDFRLWEGLVSGSADLFYRERTGIPAKMANDNAGALATYYNLNGDNTRGFELSLTHSNRIGDFNYSVGGNLSWARSKYGHQEHGQYTSGYSAWKNGLEGNWKYVRWGQTYIGHYTSYEDIASAPMHDNSNYNHDILPGDLKYEDWNGDGYIDSYDEKPIARGPFPEVMYGINFTAAWKGFDFSMFWQGGARSNFTITYYDMDAFQEGHTYENTWSYFNDRWRKADYTDPDSPWIQGHFPAIRDMFTETINRKVSNFWLYNGNYIRLKNVELGYTLPQKITRRVKIRQMRVFANLYNPLTFASQKFFDPEQAEENSYSFAGYPRIKSCNLGLNLKF